MCINQRKQNLDTKLDRERPTSYPVRSATICESSLCVVYLSARCWCSYFMMPSIPGHLVECSRPMSPSPMPSPSVWPIAALHLVHLLADTLATTKQAGVWSGTIAQGYAQLHLGQFPCDACAIPRTLETTGSCLIQDGWRGGRTRREMEDDCKR
jgi:hypothetical protein